MFCYQQNTFLNYKKQIRHLMEATEILRECPCMTMTMTMTTSVIIGLVVV